MKLPEIFMIFRRGSFEYNLYSFL